MKAMILAAGLGTRLRPLTNGRPKALVEVCGRTLLEIALRRLREFGVRDVIVNTHHYADMIHNYLKANGDFGMHIEISAEETLLDTGGGLKKAARFFLGEGADSQEPFIVHNVDVISSIDFGKMLELHVEQRGLATLAMQHRKSSRYLLFDDQGELCGRRGECEGVPEMVRLAQNVEALAFCGVHVISPQLFAKMQEEGAFSIITAYLNRAAKGERILSFRADDYYWRDLGRPEMVLQVAEEMATGKYLGI